MYFYEEFKQLLYNRYGFTWQEIFYIIGTLYDSTKGFTVESQIKFHDIREKCEVIVTWYNGKWSVKVLNLSSPLSY